MSITTLKQIVTDILGPVLKKAKTESEFAKECRMSLTKIGTQQSEQGHEVRKIKEGFKQFEEIFKLITKM